MSSYALVIKLADRLDNVQDIATAKTPEWRERYKNETEQILNYIESKRVLSGTHRKFIQLIRNKLGEINDPQEQGVAEGSEEYCDACDKVITKKPHVCPDSQGVAEGEEDLNHLQKELWDLHKEATGYRPRPGVVDWTQEQWNNPEFLKHMISKLTQQLFPQEEVIAEGPSLETTLRAIINDIGEPVLQLYSTMKNMAKQYVDRRGDLTGFQMVAAGAAARWYNNFYFNKLGKELRHLTQQAPRYSADLNDLLGKLPKSFNALAGELPEILEAMGRRMGNKELARHASIWQQARENYDQYLGDLELQGGDDWDEEDPEAEKRAAQKAATKDRNQATGKQMDQAEQIVNNVLSKLPAKVAGDIRNAIARAPNKLQALQAELQKRGVKAPIAEGSPTSLPDVLYHGGEHLISKFKIPPFGVFFSPHKEHAKVYGDAITRAKVNASPVYLVDYDEDMDEDIIDALFDRDYRKLAKYVKLLQSKGYKALQTVTDSEMICVFPGGGIQVLPPEQGVAEGSDGTKNKWYGAGKKDAAQGKTANAQRHNSKHPEETLEYMRGYKSVKQGVGEAKSAALRLAAAIQRTQGRTAAAQKNSLIPSSIPKKDEPKKDEKVAEENPNQQMALYNPNGSTYRQGKMPTLTPDPVDNADRWGDDDTDSYEQDFSKEELKRIIAQHLDALTNTQKKVLKLRFWDEMTLDEVAEEFSVSRERVRQIEAKALRKLKFSLPNANITPDTVDVAEKMLPKSAFAGSSKNKLGSAGQWKNTGPSKNRATRAGDLVGGDAQESISKQVSISEDCENIMDVLINKIIVNEAIQNFKR